MHCTAEVDVLLTARARDATCKSLPCSPERCCGVAGCSQLPYSYRLACCVL
ncbi:unnamed protein product [Ascophyllum nodosum]